VCCRHVLRPLQHSLRRPRPSQAPCANGRSGVAPQVSCCSRQIRCSSSLSSSRPIRCTPCTACHALGANPSPTLGGITGGPSCSAPSPIWLGRRHTTRARSPPAPSCWRAPPMAPWMGRSAAANAPRMPPCTRRMPAARSKRLRRKTCCWYTNIRAKESLWGRPALAQCPTKKPPMRRTWLLPLTPPWTRTPACRAMHLRACEPRSQKKAPRPGSACGGSVPPSPHLQCARHRGKRACRGQTMSAGQRGLAPDQSG